MLDRRAVVRGVALAAPLAGGSSRPSTYLGDLRLEPKVRIAGARLCSASISERMDALTVPAMSIAMFKGGRLAWTRTWSAPGAVSIDPDTRFQAASMSKPVAAGLALRLVDEGMLDLDRPVNRQLSAWTLPATGSGWEDMVSLRHLLAHSGGVNVGGFPGYRPDALTPDLLEVLAGHAPALTPPIAVEAAPGEAFRYSGGGYAVLQQLIEEAAPGGFRAAAHEALAEFGMGGARFGSAGGRRADGHDHRGARLPGGYRVYPELAAAGLWARPVDLARWAVAITRGRRRGGLLSKTARTALLTPGLGGWGLGIAVTGEGADLRITHGGANAGFRGFLVGWPHRGVSLAVMTNGDRGGMLSAEVMQAIAQREEWPGFDPVDAAAYNPERNELARFSGVYGQGYDRLELVADPQSGRLQVMSGLGWLGELIATGHGRFVDAASGARAQIAEAQGGLVLQYRAETRRRTFEEIQP